MINGYEIDSDDVDMEIQEDNVTEVVGINIEYEEDGWTDLQIPDEVMPTFKQMVQRACSTWQDMPPEIRAFKDELFPLVPPASPAD